MAGATSNAAAECHQLNLRPIKTLFINKQYRQCIRVCEALCVKTNNDDSSQAQCQRTYIKFYQALSYDELARAMHSFSQAKLPALENADKFYRQALADLPSSLLGLLSEAVDSADERLDSSDSSNLDDGATIDYCEGQMPEIPLQRLGPTAPTGGAASDQEQPRSKICLCTSTAHSSADTPYGPFAGGSVATNNLSAFRGRSDLSLSRPINKLIPSASSAPYETDLDTMNCENPTESSGSENRIKLKVNDLERDFLRISLNKSNLDRDFSRMSLIEPTGAVSKGLLRPIRPGSPAQQYFCPPIFHRNTHSQLSDTNSARAKTDAVSPVHGQAVLITDLPRNEPQLDTVTNSLSSRMSHKNLDISSHASGTISQVSDTVQHASSRSRIAYRPNSTHGASKSLNTKTFRCLHGEKGGGKEEEEEDRHLSAVRCQLQRHIKLVEQARGTALMAMASRATGTSSYIANCQSALTTSPNMSGVGTLQASTQDSGKSYVTSRLPQVKSFWSFTPSSQKEAEKQRRIVAGRRRGWKKGRFDSERYRMLAEAAMSEL